MTPFLVDVSPYCSPTYYDKRPKTSFRGSTCFYYRLGTDPEEESNRLKSKVAKITDSSIFLENGLQFFKASRRSKCNQYEIYSMTKPKVYQPSMGVL